MLANDLAEYDNLHIAFSILLQVVRAMPLNIYTLLVVPLVALIWGLASYGMYVYLASQPLQKRNWLDKTLPRRVILVLIAPFFWIGAFIFVVFIEPGWDRFLRQLNKYDRWRERKPQRRERAAERRKNFVFDPPS